MKLQFLPLHPISYRIMAMEYNVESVEEDIPIYKISSADALFHHLSYRFQSNRQQLKRMQDYLTTKVGIVTFRKITKPNQVGLYLYKIHMDQIMKMTLAKTMSGVSASQSLREVCDYYHITDDDTNIETIQRKWRRFKKKNDTILKNHHNKKQNNLPDGGYPKTLTDKQIENAVGQFIRESLDLYFTSDDRINHNLVKKTKIYFMYTFGPYDQKDIAKIIGIARRTISDHVRSFRDIVKYDPMLKDAYFKVTGSTEVN